MNRRLAIITGASRGIGAAIAKAFAQSDYDLIVTCSNSIELLQELAHNLQSEYAISCSAYQVDMGDYEQVKCFYEKINLSSLDVLVNNAGISYIGLLSDMSCEEWHRVMNTNLNSCFYSTKFSVPLMLKKHAGKIIQISSVWGNVGASMEVAYSTSKGGMNAFTKALAKELAPSNIQVNAIACGAIDTTMNSFLTEEDREVLIQEIPADRLGQPEEIASLAIQLANSPSYLTGQVITIDGGWY